MAKSNSKKKRRDTTDITNRRLPLRSTDITTLPSTLSDFEDRRNWNPEGMFAPAKSFYKPRHRLVSVPDQNVNKQKQSNRKNSLTNLFKSVPARIGFDKPKDVLICVRRKIRERVLHALKKTGKKGQRRPKFNWYSSITCKKR